MKSRLSVIALVLGAVVASIAVPITVFGQPLAQADAKELGDALDGIDKALLQANKNLVEVGRNLPAAERMDTLAVMDALNSFSNILFAARMMVDTLDAMVYPADAKIVTLQLKVICSAVSRDGEVSIGAINLSLSHLRTAAVVSEAIVARDSIIRARQLITRCM